MFTMSLSFSWQPADTADAELTVQTINCSDGIHTVQGMLLHAQASHMRIPGTIRAMNNTFKVLCEGSAPLPKHLLSHNPPSQLSLLGSWAKWGLPEAVAPCLLLCSVGQGNGAQLMACTPYHWQ